MSTAEFLLDILHPHIFWQVSGGVFVDLYKIYYVLLVVCCHY